jgi:hypothetical protein
MSERNTMRTSILRGERSHAGSEPCEGCYHELYGRDNPNEALTLLFVGPMNQKTTERVAFASSAA